jgi:hypothetical protein
VFGVGFCDEEGVDAVDGFAVAKPVFWGYGAAGGLRTVAINIAGKTAKSVSVWFVSYVWELTAMPEGW